MGKNGFLPETKKIKVKWLISLIVSHGKEENSEEEY